MRVVNEKAVTMNQTNQGKTGIPNMVACIGERERGFLQYIIVATILLLEHLYYKLKAFDCYPNWLVEPNIGQTDCCS